MAEPMDERGEGGPLGDSAGISQERDLWRAVAAVLVHAYGPNAAWMGRRERREFQQHALGFFAKAIAIYPVDQHRGLRSELARIVDAIDADLDRAERSEGSH